VAFSTRFRLPKLITFVSNAKAERILKGRLDTTLTIFPKATNLLKPLTRLTRTQARYQARRRRKRKEKERTKSYPQCTIQTQILMTKSQKTSLTQCCCRATGDYVHDTICRNRCLRLEWNH
jgi:hypothetical protein